MKSMTQLAQEALKNLRNRPHDMSAITAMARQTTEEDFDAAMAVLRETGYELSPQERIRIKIEAWAPPQGKQLPRNLLNAGFSAHQKYSRYAASHLLQAYYGDNVRQRIAGLIDAEEHGLLLPE